MPVGFAEDITVKPQAFSTRANNASSRFNGFLHHVAQAPCALHLALAGEHCRFNLKEVSPDFSPGQTVDLTDLRFFFSQTDAKALHA